MWIINIITILIFFVVLLLELPPFGKVSFGLPKLHKLGGGVLKWQIGAPWKVEMDKPLGFGRIVGLVLVAWQSNIET